MGTFRRMAGFGREKTHGASMSRGAKRARQSVDAGLEALLEDGRPRRLAASQGTARPSQESHDLRGAEAFTFLLQSDVGVHANTRCNRTVLGIAAALELDGVQQDERELVLQAGLEHRAVRMSLRHWRQVLAAAAQKVAERPEQRLRLRPTDWQLQDMPGNQRQAAHWRPPPHGRVVVGARTFTSVDATVAYLRGSGALAGAVVRADGSETTTLDVLREWPYVSVHLMAHAAAAAVGALLQPGWPRPAWATLARDERPLESLVAFFLTTRQRSRCSLHCDGVDSAWLVTAGSRDLWVLPPGAASDALPDVAVGAGRYQDTFSDYSPWEDAHRHGAWRRVSLAVGDWVYMPRGWWHVVESSPRSVMINCRV